MMNKSLPQYSSVQSLSRVWLSATPWIAARQASLSITNSQSSLRLTSVESVMPSSHLILCHPLLLLPPTPPSIRVFSNESNLRMRWPKYWSFSFSIIPSKEHPGLIFRMDWLDLLAVQGSLKSLLQHYSSKASILLHSAFFVIQLSYPYMTTGKTITLTRWTFFWEVMSLIFNILSRLVIAFLPWINKFSENWFSCSYDNLKEWKLLNEFLLSLSFISLFIYYYYYFTILYWFCHTLTWIHHRCTWVPNPEWPSHHRPHIISLGHPSAPAPSILYPVSNLD